MAKDRITREKDMIGTMIGIYCHGNHNTKKGELCDDCQKLCEYALHRLDHCRWGNEKTFCSACSVHCYKPDMREKIREVMKYSGPRIMFSHPLAGFSHMIVTMKSVFKKKKEEKAKLKSADKGE